MDTCARNEFSLQGRFKTERQGEELSHLQDLRVESLLLGIRRTQMRWFGQMHPWHLPVEVSNCLEALRGLMVYPEKDKGII